MPSSNTIIPTQNASRYLQQLCKHWSHKFEVSFTPDQGQILMTNETKIHMVAHRDYLDVTLENISAETLVNMKIIVAEHLNRFAFREAPLLCNWS